MPLYNDAGSTYNALISYNGNDVPGVTPMWGHWRPLGGFIAGMGSMMIRAVPFFVLSILGIGGPPRGGKS